MRLAHSATAFPDVEVTAIISPRHSDNDSPFAGDDIEKYIAHNQTWLSGMESLRKAGIRLDSIVIGRVGLELECIAEMTGGCRFAVSSFEQAAALCDNESVVRLMARELALVAGGDVNRAIDLCLLLDVS